MVAVVINSLSKGILRDCSNYSLGINKLPCDFMVSMGQSYLFLKDTIHYFLPSSLVTASK